jgi:hypothetical protein
MNSAMHPVATKVASVSAPHWTSIGEVAQLSALAQATQTISSEKLTSINLLFTLHISTPCYMKKYYDIWLN